VQTSISERIKDCRFVAGIGAVATVPTGSGMVLIDRDQQAFPRPVSNPFAHSRRRIRRNGAELLDDLTDC